VAICGVVDFTPFFFAYRASKSEFLIMLVTFLTTLIFGVDKGIIAGVALHIIILLKRSSAPKVKVLGRVPGTTVFRDVERYPDAVQYYRIKIVRMDESMTFASCMSFKEQILSSMILGGTVSTELPKHIIIDASSINYMDLSGLQVLNDVYDDLERRGIRLHMANVKGKVRDKIRDAPLYDKLGRNRIFLSLIMVLSDLVEGHTGSELASLAVVDEEKGGGDEIIDLGTRNHHAASYVYEPEWYI